MARSSKRQFSDLFRFSPKSRPRKRAGTTSSRRGSRIEPLEKRWLLTSDWYAANSYYDVTLGTQTLFAEQWRHR